MKRSYKLLIACALLSCLSLASCGAQETAERGEWVVTVEPTCEGEGERVKVSLADGSVLETGTVAPRGHAWGEWSTTAQPTCLTDGVETRVCGDCGSKDVRPVAALGHDWGDWLVANEPTCTSAGVETATCKRDGTHTLTRTVGTLGHDFTEWVMTSAPTCTSPGVETRYCRNDNTHQDIRTIPVLGHAYCDWYIEKAPTCTEAGVKARICANDSGHKETQTVAATGHDWSDWVVTLPPTGTSDGVETRICRNDGAHAEQNATGSPGLDFKSIEDGAAYSVRVYPSGEDIQTLYVPSTHLGKPVKVFERFSANKTALKNVIFADGVETIENAAFVQCTSLSSVVFPQSLKKIGQAAFAKTGLTSLSLSDGLETIGNYAFLDCPLERVYIPASVREMGTRPRIMPFSNKELAAFVVAPGNEMFSSLDGVLFNRDRTELIRFPAGKVCETYTVPDSVLKISEYAFTSGTGLANLVLSDSVTDIGPYAFYKNFGLTSISYGQGLKELFLEVNGYMGCNNLTSIHIPASVVKISGDFYQIPVLTAINVHPDNPNYSSAGGVLFNKEKTELLAFPHAQSGVYVVPEGVERIGYRAFAYCNGLTGIVLPNTVKEIGEGAFMCADAISEIRLSETVETVENGAFAYWLDTQTIFIAHAERPAGWSETWDSSGCNAAVVWGATF